MNAFTTTRSIRTFTILALVCSAGSSAAPAKADIVGSSSAYGISANVHLLSNSIGINVLPAATASGNAPGMYNVTNSVANIGVSAPLAASLGTGVLVAHADSNLAASAFTGFTHANAQVNGLNLRVVPGLLPILDVLNLTASTITSSAQVAYNGTAFVLTGGFTIENLHLDLLSFIPLAATANAAANTVLLDAAGIRIVLNEQIQSVVGNTASLTVNALHISITGPLQTVGTDVIIGHSQASMVIPAPSAAAALGGMVFFARRRRR